MYTTPFNLPPSPIPEWLRGQDGIPVVLADENEALLKMPLFRENALFVGSTGFGKTTLFKSYLDSRLSECEENLFSVLLDVKDDFRGYLRPNEKLVSISKLNENPFKWNIIRELRQAPESEIMLYQIVDILFMKLDKGKDPFWVESGKAIVRGFIETILNCYSNNPSNFEVISAMRGMTDQQLRDHIALYAPNTWIVRAYISGNDKRTGDTRAFVSAALQQFTGLMLSNDGQDTIRSFLNGEYGSRMVLAYDPNQSAASSAYFSMILRIIIGERLSQTVDRKKSVFLGLDEAPVLGCDFGLLDAATVGRGNNLQICLATQSLEKMYTLAPTDKTYGDALINSTLSGFPVMFVFHPPGDRTLDTVTQIFGSENTRPLSRYGGASEQDKPIVSSGSLARLKKGEFYAKYNGEKPFLLKTVRPSI